MAEEANLETVVETTKTPAAPAADTTTTAETPAEVTTDQAQTPQDAAPEVPEAYEVTPPEGVNLDTDLLDKFTPVFKKAGMGNAEVQEVVNQFASHQAEVVQKQSKDWKAKSMADPEIGGNNWEKTKENAGKALAHYAKDLPELTAMVDGPLGNHPEFIKLLSRLGKDMSEGSFIAGRTSEPVISTAQKFYPGMNP